MCLARGELWHGVASVAQGKFFLGKGSIFLLSGGCLLGYSQFLFLSRTILYLTHCPVTVIMVTFTKKCPGLFVG